MDVTDVDRPVDNRRVEKEVSPVLILKQAKQTASIVSRKDGENLGVVCVESSVVFKTVKVHFLNRQLFSKPHRAGPEVYLIT